VAHTGGPARFVFGEMDGSNGERAELLLQACRGAGIDAEISGRIRQLLWEKFAFICAQAGATAAVRLTIGEIRAVEESWTMFRRIVEEVCGVASAEGIELPEDTVERHVRFAGNLEPGSYSSLHYDLTQGRPLELQALHGTVVRLARRHGIAVPTCETVHAILRPWEVRNAAKSSA
jgi:2-dehydropantoate 2-reductase